MWKKIIYPLALLVIITSVYFLPYFRLGLPFTHDGQNHTARLAQYYLAFKQGQFPPRLGPTLANGYSLPVFNYNYPLANILSLPLNLGKLAFETQFKVLVIFGFCFAAIGFYQLLRVWQIPSSARYLAVIFYLYSPYLYTAIWYRGSLGEIWQFYLLPWVLFTFEIALLKPKKVSFSFSLLSLILFQTAFLLAHNVMVLIIAPLLLIYQLYRLRQRHMQTKKYYLLAGLLSLGLAAWFWLPAWGERHLVNLANDSLNLSYHQHFLHWSQLFSPFFSSGLSYAGSVDSLSMGLSLAQVLVLVASIYLLARHHQLFAHYQQPLFFLIFLSSFFIFFALPYSQFAWKLLPLLSYIQFPWRLFLPLNFCLAILSSYLLVECQRFFTVLLTASLIWQVLMMTIAWPQNFTHFERDYYLNYPLTTTTSGENFARTFVYPYFQDNREQLIFLLYGEGELEISKVTSTDKQYQLNCRSDSCLVVEQTAFFPGFITTANQQRLNYTDNEQIGGRIAYQLPAGRYHLHTRFSETTPYRLLGDAITLISLIILLYKLVSHWANFSLFTKMAK